MESLAGPWPSWPLRRAGGATREKSSFAASCSPASGPPQFRDGLRPFSGSVRLAAPHALVFRPVVLYGWHARRPMNATGTLVAPLAVHAAYNGSALVLWLFQT